MTPEVFEAIRALLREEIHALNSPTMSMSEAGEALGCSRATLFRLAKRGQIRMLRGKPNRVVRKDVYAYVDALPRRRSTGRPGAAGGSAPKP